MSLGVRDAVTLCVSAALVSAATLMRCIQCIVVYIATLCDIVGLLSGEVPNLFPADEKAEICEKMRQLDRQKDRAKQTDGSQVALFNMFVQRCRDQLHVVLAMSPIGDAFRNRLRKFPSLVNCCTIDWFQSWPADALQVALRYCLCGRRLMPHSHVRSCISTRVYVVIEHVDLY